MNKFEQILADYGPYIDDLWSRIYKLAFVFIILFVLGFFEAGWLMKHFISLFALSGVTIIVTSPFQFIDLAVSVGLFVAFVFCTPIAIWNFYAFLRPAVSKTEFSVLLKTLPVSLFLFFFGFAYGFFALYWGLRGLAEINIAVGLKNYWDIGLFISQLFMTATLLGILFQFPIIIYILVKMGVIQNQLLQSKRRVVYAGIVVIVAILPPTDGLSLIIMSVPLVLMYEIIVLITRSIHVEKNLVA
jgi:sec-independent protein translocase protein TatC